MVLIKLLVEGGKMTPGPTIAQTLGPMGINIGQVISEVNEKTKEFNGITVPVHLEVDGKTKKFSIKILSPPTSELLKKEARIEKASAARLKQIVGNLAIEQVISVAKSKHDSMLSREFISTVKSIIGTCQAMGLIIENKDAKTILKDILKGMYNKEINSRKTDISPEKKEQLNAFYKEIESKQEAAKKAEEAEKALAEEQKAKEAATTGATATVATATPSATATPAAKTATPAVAAKPAAKPAKPEKK